MSETKKPFLSIKVFIVILVALIIVTVIAASGIFYIPGFSEVLGTNKPRDLGVKADPARFNALLAQENVKLSGQYSNYYLTAPIKYGSAVPMDTTVSSEDLTSMMQATNNAKGPLKDMQVKLGNNNEMEMTAYADLETFGYPVKGPIYLKGTFLKGSSSSVNINIREGNFGLIPVPENVLKQGEDGLEQELNRQLSNMQGLRIDQLEITNGQLHYSGAFPQSASA
jgi:flagellar capping protein FliD